MLSMWFKVGTQGNKSQQYVMVRASSLLRSTSLVTSCRNMLSNRFMCTGEFLWKSLSLQQNFVAVTSFKKSNQTEFV